MPDKMVAQLIRFLDYNNGELLNRARNKEFQALTLDEIKRIEKEYQAIFLAND